MIQRTFPCVFLSRTYSSYAICTKKKKKNIEETLRYSPSKDQPSRRLITQRTFARKKEKKRTTPADSQPQEKLRRGTWTSALCRVTRVVESFFPLPPLLFLLASLCTCARTLHARSKTPSNIAKRKMLRRARWFPIMRFTVFTFRLITLPIPRSTPRELWPYFHKTRSHVLFGERGRIYLRRDISETDFRRGGRPPGDDQSVNVKVKCTRQLIFFLFFSLVSKNTRCFDR